MILPCIQNLLSSSAAVCEEASETTSSRTATQRARFASRLRPLRERADRVSNGSGVPSLHRLLNRAHGGRSRERRTAGSARCCPRATRERNCKRGRTWIFFFFFFEQSVTHMDGRGPFLLSSFGPLAVNQGRAIHFSRLDLARYVRVWPISNV